MRVLLAPFIFVLHFILQISNLALWGALIIAFGLVKLIVPQKLERNILNPMMNCFLLWFGQVSVGLIRLFNNVRLEYRIDGHLDREGWYLLLANHLSYLDIILMIQFAHGRIPPPKFFLKKELIWMPFVGLGAWALDMPFMRRYSREFIARNPHLKGKDIETTRKSCEKFKYQPTTVINFVEGTRFTPEKQRLKNNQYRCLLPPKAGGIAFTLAAMGELFTNILDVSLAYPQNRKHPMFAMLGGQMRHIVVDVTVLPVTEDVIGDYFNDDIFRGGFQRWLNDLWVAKDKRLQQLLGNE
ncbi:acyltransferase [Alteromonas oceanisediminis]|uniref:acyltransferase n=1 Tax=Alteromonas oceanisediminis TaxID=2836180 RepID=UPI001BD96B19|nr:acyltransferase [Alteromonas oceanisediminis]MBT0585871.1 acyltransferase [Alteromonas oceanisediminis]